MFNQKHWIILRPLKLDSLFPIAHPHAITVLYGFIHYLAHVRSCDGSHVTTIAQQVLSTCVCDRASNN